MTVAAYRARVEAGGCCRLDCEEQGRHEFAVWWKCPEGHRLELRYCKAHGPEHLEIAMRGGMLECRACRCLMTPLIEGWQARG